jgi:phosphoglycolate phosphatase-like HAD superfamily hydrolase
MITLVAFDLDGTLAESKQPLKDTMGETLADLLAVAHIAVISGGDWPQFQKQVASRLPSRADLSKRAHRGPRQPNHLLGAGAGGARRGEGDLGPGFC